MQIIPREIHKGMTVRDNANQEVGIVNEFRFSENEDTPEIDPADIDGTDRPHNLSIIQQFAQALVPNDLPDELRDRLLMEGYVCVHASGPFGGRLFVLPGQILAATDGSLTLSVSKAELIHRAASDI